jgi:hypothetical protein
VPWGIRQSAVLTESGNGSAFDNGSVLRVRDNGSVSWSSGRLSFSSGSAEANGSALKCVLDAIEWIQVVNSSCRGSVSF